MHYLRFLASIGASDIHPGGAIASAVLVKEMHIRSGMSILELGCGTGKTLQRLATTFDVTLCGVDLLPEMLREAHERLRTTPRPCSLLQANATAIPFRDNTFDRIFVESVLGLQSEADFRVTLGEIRRVLRPGGTFLAIEAIWSPRTSQEVVNNANRLALADFGLRPGSESVWSADHWIREIANAGLTPLSWDELSIDTRSLARSNYKERWRKLLRFISSSNVRRDYFSYRRKLALYRNEATAMESRIFIANKPA